MRNLCHAEQPLYDRRSGYRFLLSVFSNLLVVILLPFISQLRFLCLYNRDFNNIGRKLSAHAACFVLLIRLIYFVFSSFVICYGRCWCCCFSLFFSGSHLFHFPSSNEEACWSGRSNYCSRKRARSVACNECVTIGFHFIFSIHPFRVYFPKGGRVRNKKSNSVGKIEHKKKSTVLMRFLIGIL